VCRVAAIEPECGGVFSHDAIDRIGIHAAASFLPLAVVLERAEQWPVAVAGMPRGLDLGDRALRGVAVPHQMLVERG
jgi:hypothetical protein